MNPSSIHRRRVFSFLTLVVVSCLGLSSFGLAGSGASESLSSPASSVTPSDGWVPVGDDAVVRYLDGAAPRASMPRFEGPGFLTFAGMVRNRGHYTFVLKANPEIEQWRDEIQVVADDLEATTGGTYTVAPGTTTASEAGVGEIIVMVSLTSPCGSLGTGGAVGCGGPTYDENGVGVDGRVWLAPTLDNDHSAHIGQAVVTHEIGHALGLDHFDEDHLGLPQVMRSFVSADGASMYRAGDKNGLIALQPPPPPPNDNFADAIVLPPPSGNVVGTTTASTRETGEPGPSLYSVWYEHTTASSGGIFQLTIDSEVLLVPHVIEGTLGSYVETGYDSSVIDAEGLHLQYELEPGTTYAISLAGQQGDFDLHWAFWPCVEQFSDVSDSHPFCTEITWLSAEGIAEGFPDGTYRPVNPVTRQSMAAFLYRLAGEPPVVPGGTEFPDVPADHPFHDEIAWMVAEGITTGYDDGTFRPGEPVRRQALSAFLYRFVGSPDPSGWENVVSFVDVPLAHPFHDEIGWMEVTGMSLGFAGGTFRPGDDVTRQSMAAFLFRGVTDGPLALS